MPRKFRTDEEETIRGALLEAAARIMGARGVRKTTIDELVREGGISKGSFYRFFPGKEALALEVLARWERDFHLHIRRFFQESAPRVSERRLKRCVPFSWRSSPAASPSRGCRDSCSPTR